MLEMHLGASRYFPVEKVHFGQVLQRWEEKYIHLNICYIPDSRLSAFFVGLEVEPRFVSMLGKHYPRATSSALSTFLISIVLFKPLIFLA